MIEKRWLVKLDWWKRYVDLEMEWSVGWEVKWKSEWDLEWEHDIFQEIDFDGLPKWPIKKKKQ